MANRNTQGYGLIPVATLGNTPSTQGQSAYKIEAAYGTSIYNGAPVVSAAGYMTENQKTRWISVAQTLQITHGEF